MNNTVIKHPKLDPKNSPVSYLSYKTKRPRSCNMRVLSLLQTQKTWQYGVPNYLRS